MKEKVLYVIISILMAAGLLTAVPAYAQSTQPAPGTGGWGGGRGGAQHAPGVFGTVTAISGDSITLSSKAPGQNATATTYAVNATSATVTKAGAASSVGAIAVGDTLMVQGTVSGDSVTATKIDDGVGGGMMGGRGGMQPGVFGTVSAISGTMLTVTSKAMVGPQGSNSSAAATTYTVDASSATVMKNNATSSVSAIAVGDTVMVQGTVSGDSVTAKTIRDGVVPQGVGQPGKGPGMPGQAGAIASLKGNGEPVIGGSITAINGDTLTVTNKSNVTYSVDATNATIIVKNATSSLASVSTGDNVVVQGTVNGTSVTASSVIDQGAAATTSGTGSGPMRGIGDVFGAIGGFIQHLFGFF